MRLEQTRRIQRVSSLKGAMSARTSWAIGPAGSLAFRGGPDGRESRGKDWASLVASLFFLAGSGFMIAEDIAADRKTAWSTWCWAAGCSLYTAISAQPFFRPRKKPPESEQKDQNN